MKKYILSFVLLGATLIIGLGWRIDKILDSADGDGRGVLRNDIRGA